ncbi:hypothetical protein BC940DRAFT_312264 [Gongronella butleri]|nr:hypothetical protein BC940DRAFT_312264 [Gongronella butleri]
MNSNNSSSNSSVGGDHSDSPVTKKSAGGRHRIFTNEQRKVRNRQAQAAFRQRRTAYTKTLETTIEQMEAQMATMEMHAIEADKRADQAEKRCVQLEAAYLNVHRILQCLLPTPAAPFRKPLHEKKKEWVILESLYFFCPQFDLASPPPMSSPSPTLSSSATTCSGSPSMDALPIVADAQAPVAAVLPGDWTDLLQGIHTLGESKIRQPKRSNLILGPFSFFSFSRRTAGCPCSPPCIATV